MQRDFSVRYIEGSSFSKWIKVIIRWHSEDYKRPFWDKPLLFKSTMEDGIDLDILHCEALSAV